MRGFLFAGALCLGIAPNAWGDTPSEPALDPHQPAPNAQAPIEPSAIILDAERFADSANGDEIIVQIRYDGGALADGISGELWPGGLRLPLGQLASVFEFPIQVDPATGLAEGWFVREDRRFTFDANTRTGRAGRDTISAREGAVHITADDIYVDITELSSWFPLNFEVSLESLHVDVKGRETLPLQQRATREASRQRLFARFGVEETGVSAPRQALPYEVFSSPFFGLRQELDWGTSEGERYAYDLHASADLAWMSGRINLSGQDGEGISNTRVSLGRDDPYGRLPGGLTRFEIGDTFTPTSPLISRGTGGRGLMISNAPLVQADLFDRTVLRGTLPAGYDVELYRNGALIASQASRGDGLYEFLDVPLEFGDNELRLVFYGPRGETSQRVQRLRVGDDFLSPGKVNFQFGAVQQNENVITPAREVGAQPGAGEWRSVVRADVGVSQNLTFTGALAATPVDNSGDVQTLASIGARLGLGGMALRGDMVADQDGAHAASVGASGRILGLSFGIDHVEFGEGFRSDATVEQSGDVARIDNMRLSATLPLGFVRLPLDLSFERLERASGGLDLEGTFRTTMPLWGGMLVSNSLNYQQIGGIDRFDGEVDLNIDWNEWLFRGGYRYVAEEDDPRGTSFSLQADRPLTDSATLRLSSTHDFASGGTQTSGSLNWRIQNAELGFGASYDDTQGEARAQMSLNFGFGRDYHRRRWVMSADDLAETGMSRPFVYLDNNANGVRDEGDQPLEGVRVGANSGRDNETGADGEVLLTSLDAGRPVVVSLDPASLPDPYMMAAVEAIEIVPRAGRIHVLEFPVVQTGSVEGTTSFAADDGERPVGNVRLELVNARGEIAAATVSEYDGFYAFERVRPGDYALRLEPARARELGVGTQAIANIHVGPDGSVMRGINLVLRRESAGATMLASATPTAAPAPILLAQAQPVQAPPPPVSEALNVPAATPILASAAPSMSEALNVPAATPILASAVPSIIASAIPSTASASGMLVFEYGGARVAVPHMELLLRRTGGGVVRTFNSDERGAFVLTGLAAGAYEITPERIALASRSLKADGALRVEVPDVASEPLQLGALIVRSLDETPAPVAAPMQVAYQPPPPVTTVALEPLRSFTPESGRGGELWSPPVAAAEPNGAPLFSAVSGQLRLVASGRDFALAGVSLRVVSENGDVVHTVTTARDGTFESAGLARGSYRIEADRLALASRGVRLESVRFEIGAEAAALALVARPLSDTALALLQTAPSRHQNISAAAASRPVQQAPHAQASMTGRVVLASNAQADGLAGIELNILDRGGAVVQAVTTREDGSFQTSDLPVGLYFVVADRRSTESRAIRVEPVAPINLDGAGARDLGVIVARTL